MRIAVSLGTLRIPPTYFAVQHTERLTADDPKRFSVRTVAMAVDIADAAVRDAGLDIVEAAALPGGSFRRREVTMPLSIGRAVRAIGDFSPDVIHQHFATWSSPAVRAAERSGAPLIVTVHGADVFAALRPLSAVPVQGRPMLAWHHRSVRRAFEGAGTVLAVSRFLAGQAITAGADPSRVDVHFQGIDTDFFAPEYSVVPDMPEVLFVGAFSTAKGVLDLVQASTEALPRAEHRLVFAGSGPLHGALTAIAASAPHVDVVGALDRLAVRDRIRRASVLVLPTQFHNGWREAAGLVLLEAQACAVPVIAYDSGGAPEMLQDGQTGVVVPERDLSALASAIVAVLNQTSTDRDRMRAAARRFVVEHRSLAVSAAELGERYAGLAR